MKPENYEMSRTSVAEPTPRQYFQQLIKDGVSAEEASAQNEPIYPTFSTNHFTGLTSKC